MRHLKWIWLVGSLIILFSTRLAAQSPNDQVIGFLSLGSPYEWTPFVAAFRQGLAERGYFEGLNTSIQFRWALSHVEQIPALARDLASRDVDVIVSTGGIPSFNSSVTANPTIPVVAIFGDDPLSDKLAADVESPGTNATGVSLHAPDIDARRLKIMQSIMPIATIGLLLNGRIVAAAGLRERFESAIHQLGLHSVVALAGTEEEIDKAFVTLSAQHVDAVVMATSAYFLDYRDRFAALAIRYKLPVMYPARAYVEAGGLLSYGVDRLDAYRHVGRYTGKILHGEAAGDLPVLRPTKFELVVNAKAAKALGLTIPQSLLTLADVVIR